MSNFDESVYKVGRSNGYGLRWETAGNGDRWCMGIVTTPHGYVRVYAEPKHLSLSIIHDGYEVHRVYRKTYSHNSIVTLARRFAEEMQS